MVQTENVDEHITLSECLELFDVSENWICFIFKDEEKIFINDSFAKFFGLTEQVIKKDRWFTLFEEEDQEIIGWFLRRTEVSKVPVALKTASGHVLNGDMKRISPSKVIVTGSLHRVSAKDNKKQFDSPPPSHSIDHFMAWLSLLDGQLNRESNTSQSMDQMLLSAKVSPTVYTRIKEVVEHIPHGFAIISKDWEVLYVNPTLEDILCRKHDDLCHKNVWEIFPREKYPAYYENFSHALNTNQVVKFQEYIYGHGKVVDVTAYPSNGELTVFIQDITEVNTYIAALQETEERFSLLADNINEAFWVLSSNFKTWEYMSPTFESIFGLPISEVEQDYFVWVNKVHNADRERVIRSLRKMRVEKVACEYRFEYKPGVWKWIRTKGYPLEKADKVLTVGVHEDITDLKEKDELIAQSEQFETITRVAAGIAHEIKNPLTSIRGFLQLMMSGDSGNNQYADIVFSELSRIESIVNEFMLLAKPDQDVELEETNVIDIIHYVIALFRAQCRQGGISVSSGFDPSLPLLPSDPKRLKQIFINVIKNAIEAIDGEGELSIVGTYKDDVQCVVIEISDSGKGIEMEHLKRIGEPFFTTKEKGTGLGMMVTTKFVESLGGTIQYKSSKGEGTTVTIALPVLELK